MGLEAATYIEDLNSANPLFNDGKVEGDDHIRLIKAALKATLPGLAGAAFRVQSKSSAYTVVANDNTTLITATSAFTLTLTAAATLGNKHMFVVDAVGGDVTIDPDGTETINGLTTMVVPQNTMAVVWCTGTAFIAGVLERNPRAIATITGNTTLTASTFEGMKEVTAGADVTLPAASAALIGKKMLLHSSTTASVRVVPDGSNTIEGINAAYRVPSWTTIELLCVSATSFVLLRAAPYAVGQLVPFSVAQTLPGFIAANFAAVSRTTYAGLYNVIGTTHGLGDGSTTFNVPDTRSRTLVGTGTGTLAEDVSAASVDTTLDTFTVASNDDSWVTGMAVVLTTTSGLPAPLALATTYYTIRNSATTIKFATSLANAQNETAINLTTQGVGTHTITHTLLARTAGKRLGEDAHAMNINELLLHTHGIGINNLVTGAGLSGQATPSDSVVSGTRGGNTAMNNMQPSLVVPYYVKT